MDVFSAFPNGVESGRYEAVEVEYGTEIGTELGASFPLDVIVEEGNDINRRAGATASYEDCDILLYAKPDQLPVAIPQTITNGYVIHDTATNFYYEIKGADVGKNQGTGAVEHVELWLKQTEVNVDGE